MIVHTFTTRIHKKLILKNPRRTQIRFVYDENGSDLIKNSFLLDLRAKSTAHTNLIFSSTKERIGMHEKLLLVRFYMKNLRLAQVHIFFDEKKRFDFMRKNHCSLEFTRNPLLTHVENFIEKTAQNTAHKNWTRKKIAQFTAHKFHKKSHKLQLSKCTWKNCTIYCPSINCSDSKDHFYVWD